jgi:hypothetical protein
MIIEKETSKFNARRYGKPWAAIVDFAEGKASYLFCDWIGEIDGGVGLPGILRIYAEEGDIVAIGQKDYRKNRSNMDWYVVRNGQLVYLPNGKAEAFKVWEEIHKK